MSKNPKQIAAELDQTRARLDASVSALTQEARSFVSPSNLLRLGTSGTGRAIADAITFLRDLLGRGRA